MESLNRRQFVKTGILGAAALAAPGWLRAAEADPFRGLKVGIASYSLRKFTLDQAIEMTREAGVRHICLKDMHLSLKSTLAQRQEARRKVQAGGLVLMGCGVVYMANKEPEIRNVFEYARDAGMPAVVCSPDPAALDTVEKMAREFKIRVAIHNHGPGDKRYPSPLDVLKMVKDRDELMGVCMDVGHSVRLGEDPVAVIRQCGSRLHDFHIKDVNQAVPKGASVVVGKGVIPIPAVLKALMDLKFSGHVALEYEDEADAPMPGIKASFEYMRKVMAGMA